MLVTRKSVYMLTALMVTTGCASTPDLSTYSWPERPTKQEAEATVVTHLNRTLIDPESLRYECLPPLKGWGFTCNANGVGGGCGNEVGYIVVCDINAKNRMGGYAGSQRHYYMLQGISPNLSAFDMEIDPAWIHFVEDFKARPS